MSEPMIERIVRIIAANGGRAMKQNEIVQALVLNEHGGGGVIPEALKEKMATTVNGALYSERGKHLLINTNGSFTLNGAAVADASTQAIRGRGGARADGKVFWTDAEREQVAQRLAELRRGDMQSRIGTLLRRAQEVLPEPRRRRLVSPAQMKILSERVAQLLAREKVVLEQNPPQILEVHVECAPDYEKLRRSLPTPELVAILAERFIATVDAIALREGQGVPPTRPAHVTPPPNPPTPPPPPQPPRKTRVGIIGLDGDREHVLQKVRHLDLEIVFLDGHHHHTPARADFYIIHKTAAHAWHDRLKSQVSSSRVFFADGGISEIVRFLHDIHARKKSP
jgi:hypothetical protein